MDLLKTSDNVIKLGIKLKELNKTDGYVTVLLLGMDCNVWFDIPIDIARVYMKRTREQLITEMAEQQ
jgi:hypothetical protein